MVVADVAVGDVESVEGGAGHEAEEFHGSGFFRVLWGWGDGMGVEVGEEVLVVELDAGFVEVVAVEEMDGVDHGKDLVVVGAEGAHLLFEPGVVGEAAAQLVGVLDFDEGVGDVAVAEELDALPQGAELAGGDGEGCGGIALADKLVGVDLAEAAGDVAVGPDEGVLVESLETVADFLAVDGVEPGVEDFHVVEGEGHAGGLGGEGSVAEEVDGTFDSVVAHDVGMDFEDDLLGVEAVEVAA